MDATSGEIHPLLKQRYHRARTVFAPGSRLRMNIIPMFLGVMIPWCVFIFVMTICTFWIMHTKPWLGMILVGISYAFWFAICSQASSQRKHNPDPTWWSFFAVMIGLAVVCGSLFGGYNYQKNLSNYYGMQDLKVVSHIDPDVEVGQTVMDAGVFYFADSTHIDVSKSWHFMGGSPGTLYCVAPITASRGSPVTQSYDFWAVGKDCCSMSAADFRCGDWSAPKSRSAIRVFDEDAIKNYKLAVKQSETMYGMMATHPVFFDWHEDPLGYINKWLEIGFAWWLKAITVFFVVCLFCMIMAVTQFAFIGRRESIYEQSVLEAPYWAHYNPPDRDW